ncbi:MAG TPA: alpha/beta hydrolase-fold protein [Streptosporangiaceae bacterium]
MFGPQSPLVLILLVAGFVGLTCLVVRGRPLWSRLLASTGTFVIAAVFGMAIVNKYYDYYQTWGDLYDDLTGRQPGVSALPPAGHGALRILRQDRATGERAKKGLLLDMMLAGRQSGISRYGLVYLPPEYFWRPYATARFPVVELLNGSPGMPSDWERMLHTSEVFRRLLHDRKAAPAVLVAADVNGGPTSLGQQCLDVPGGLRDDTYLSKDVPRALLASLRVQRPGPHWAIAGYSEGGFCAANLALRHPGSYGAAGVMSGYFQPLPRQGADLFRGDARARLANDPLWLAEGPRRPRPFPAFWLMAGRSDRGDVVAARTFKSVVDRREPGVPLVLVPHAGHTFAAWIPALPKLLGWATHRIAVPWPPGGGQVR